MNSTDWDSILSRFITFIQTDKGLAPLTVRNYKTDLQPLYDFMEIRKIIGLEELDRYTLRSYLSWLVELGYVRSSIVRKLSAVRSFLRW